MSSRNVLRSLLLLPVALAVLAAGGCIFDPSEGGDPPPPPPPFQRPTTPDKLMENFERAYNETNQQEYQKVLHEDFIFVPLPDDLGELGLSPGEYVLRAQELAITEKIFSGKAGTSGAPGIQGIDVVLLEPETTWGASTYPDFPDALEALYRVEIHFKHADGYFRVKGQQKFMVQNVPDDGGNFYYLIGQWDFTTAGPE
jgi:hypothetical protein